MGGGHIDIHDVTTQWGVFALAGPNSPRDPGRAGQGCRPRHRAVEQALPVAFVRATSNWACARCARSAWPIPASWAGNCTTRSNSAAICGICCWSAGEKHGLKRVGARAQNWLRQEKSYRAFGNELGRDATPLGGRARPLCRPGQGIPRQGRRCWTPASGRNACTVLIDGPTDTDPWGKEALLLDGEKIGRLTSGGYSVAFGKQIGMGYVRPDLAEVGHEAEGEDAAAGMGCGGGRGQPVRPDERPHPGGWLTKASRGWG